MTKKYGSVPEEMRPYLPALVDAFRRGGAARPYSEAAEVFGCSASRIQQIVLAERRKAQQAALEEQAYTEVPF